MKTIKSIKEARKLIIEAKSRGEEIGFVPTMGFLHEGHLSLVREAVRDNKFVVVSIFVNPAQFGPNEDYESYPRDLGHDTAKLAQYGVDIIFSPEPEEMYPLNYNTYVTVKELTRRLCGSSRPIHFQGVTTIVSKLFNIVQPDRAYFGEKDYQQLLVIKRMVNDLNFPVKIIGVPTVREKDGLALSSRNKYLSLEERKQAVVLYRALMKARELVGDENVSNIDKLKRTIMDMIENQSLARIDYVELLDPDTLEEIQVFKDRLLIALAVYFGDTRLIDNIVIRD